MAECTASEHEDVAMTDLEDGEDYDGNSSSSSSQSAVTLPPEVWANVIDCEYCLYLFYCYLFSCIVYNTDTISVASIYRSLLRFAHIMCIYFKKYTT